MIPTEAIEWMMSRASVSKDDFYNNIDPKARYRAFTVSKLTSLDAIERTKELLNKTLEEGETMKEWYDRLKSDEILSKIGFHENNPFYLETVFRTNTISAYNAGRWEEIQMNKENIAFLEYVAIDDSRTTEICSALDGVRLPPDDPFWKTHYPPNHFNCRSQVIEVSPDEVEVFGYKETEKDKIDEINGVPIPKGFDTPIEASWWDETESMKKRAEKYGIDDEIKKKKQQLNLKNKENGSIIDFVVGKSLGAMAKRFYVKVRDYLINSPAYIKEGTTVTGVKILYKGEKIKDVNRLIKTYKLQNGEETKVKDWIKARGTAIIKHSEKEFKAEIHWYQCKNIGKVEFKVKREYDES